MPGQHVSSGEPKLPEAVAASPKHLPLRCLTWPVSVAMSAITNLPTLLSNCRQDPTWQRAAQCLLFSLMLVFVTAWTLHILTAKNSGQGQGRRDHHVYSYLLLLMNTLSSVSLYFMPMDLRGTVDLHKLTHAPAQYIVRCLLLAMMLSLSDMAPKDLLPVLLGGVVPIHALLDLLQCQHLCSLITALDNSAAAMPFSAALPQQLCSSVASLLLRRSLPLAIGTVVVALATHTLISSPSERDKAAVSAGVEQIGCWQRWLRRCMALTEVVMASRSINLVCGVSSFICATALVAMQVNHIQRGEAASPLEVLMGLVAGVCCGIIKSKVILTALHHQLHDVSALLYDMVPKHVADSMLLDRNDASRQPSVTPTYPQSAPSKQNSASRALAKPSSFLRNSSSEELLPGSSPPIHALLRPAGRKRDSSAWSGAISVTSDDALSDDALLINADDLGPSWHEPGFGTGGASKCEGPPSPVAKALCSPRQSQMASRSYTDLSGKLNPQPVYAAHHDSCSVLFADIVSFTQICQQLEPKEIMDMLNQLYHHLDGLCLKMAVYKVETIGDCYMAATGLVHNDPLHAATMMQFAVAMLQQARKVVNPLNGDPLRLRVGISSGPAFSGVVGRIRKRYCLFGDTVVEASRMESHGVPGAIHVSAGTYDELQRIQSEVPSMDTHLKQLVGRGGIDVKGRGHVMTWLLSEGASCDADL